MNDYDWISDYIGEDTKKNAIFPASTSPRATLAPKKSKANKRDSKEPWFSKFPPTSRVRAMRAQFFDNGPKPGKGRNQHTLKLRVYLDDGQPLNLREPPWHRIVELIDPKKVVTWAEDEHAANRLSDDALATYQSVAAELVGWKNDDPEAAWVKMGHISSPPGSVYFHGQFVAVRCEASGEMQMVLHLVGDEAIEIDRFHANKSKTKDAPKRYGLYDPEGLIDRRERDDE